MSGKPLSSKLVRWLLTTGAVLAVLFQSGVAGAAALGCEHEYYIAETSIDSINMDEGSISLASAGRFLMTPDTVLQNAEGGIVGLDYFREGMDVSATACLDGFEFIPNDQAGAELVAEQIRGNLVVLQEREDVPPPPPPLLEIEGTVVSVIVPLVGDGLGFSVETEAGEATVWTTPNTMVSDVTTKPLTQQDIAVNDRIRAIGTGSTESLNASQVVILGSNLEIVEQRGFIVEMGDGDCFELTGEFTDQIIRVCATNETSIASSNGGELAYADLAAQDLVRVVGVFSADGESLIARSIVRIDESEPQNITVEGEITDISTAGGPYIASIYVERLQFLVSEGTEVLNQEGEPIEFESLVAGDYVSVSGAALPDPPPPGTEKIIAPSPTPTRLTYSANRIQVLERHPVDPVVFEGEITAIVPGVETIGRSIDVDNETVAVPDGTEITDVLGRRLPFRELALGDLVRVAALPATGPNAVGLAAISIQLLNSETTPTPSVTPEPTPTVTPEPTPLRVEVEGEIHEFLVTVAIYQGGFQVNDVSVLVALDAELVDREGNALTFADFQVGDRIRAIGEPQPVLELPGKETDPEQPPFVSIVADRVVLLRKAESTPTPSITPTTTPEPTPVRVEVEGDIREFLVIPAIYQAGFRVNDFEVLVALDAELLDREGNIIAITDFAIGDRIHAVGTGHSNVTPPVEEGPETKIPPPLPNHTIIADRVVLLQKAVPPAPEQFRGTIVEFAAEGETCFTMINPDTPFEIRVCANEETEITDGEGGLLTFDELEIGDFVEVLEASPAIGRGTEPANNGQVGSPLPPIRLVTAAKIVRIEDVPTPGPVHLRGEIVEIGAERPCFLMTNQLSDTTQAFNVCTNDDTIIRTEEGEPIEFARLAAGDLVFVTVDNKTDTSRIVEAEIVATEIVLLERHPQEPVIVDGLIQAINRNLPRSITLDNTTFRVTGDTIVQDREGNEVAFSSLRVGDNVLVEGLVVETNAADVEASNALVAISITLRERVQSPTPTVTVTPSPTRPPTPTPTITTPSTRELIGVLSELDSETGCFVLVDDRVVIALAHAICTTDETRIIGIRNTPLTFADLKEGDRAEVLVAGGDEHSTASLVAIRIRVIPAGEGRVEIRGPVVSISPGPTGSLGVVTVGEVPFLVTANTELIGLEGGTVAFDEIEVGERVLAIGRRDLTDATVVALSIRLLPDPIEPPVEVRLAGVVESIDLEMLQLVVRGNLVQVGPDTKFINREGNLTGLEVVEVGDEVVVEGTRNAEGTILAGVVIVKESNNPGEPIEFDGAISEIDGEDGILVVAGRTVIVSDETEIVGLNGGAISLRELSVGQLVEVRGMLARETTRGVRPEIAVLATRIAVKSRGCTEFAIVGVLREKSNDGWQIGERLVRISDATTFSGPEEAPLTADDFAVGDQVRALGCSPSNETPVARHIVKLGGEVPPPDECDANVAFAGPVDAVDVDNATLVVDGRRVSVTDDTTITMEEVGVVGLGDISVGMIASVDGVVTDANVAVVACRIRVRTMAEPPPPQEHRIVGKIDSIDPTSKTLTVRNLTVLVTEETRIETRRETPIGFGDLETGLLVDVRGKLHAGGVLEAARIRVQEENTTPHPVRPFTGAIQSLGLPDFLVVREKNVLLTTSTRYVGFEGEDIDPLTLAVGDRVTVFPVQPTADVERTDAVVTAAVIALSATVVEEIDADARTIVTGGNLIAIVDETVIRDLRAGEISFADLAVGDLVKVRTFDTEPFPPHASLILRVNGSDFSGPVGDMNPTEHGHENGHPTIESNDPGNTFGFVSLPLDMGIAEPNTLYEILMKVSTNVTDPLRVPAARVRVNMRNFEKGATYVVNSAATFSHVPNERGRQYSLLFVPPADLAVENEEDAQFFASLDLLSFEDRFARNARFRLESVAVNPIDNNRIVVVDTLARDEFVSGTEGWELGGVDGVFTVPEYGSASGELTLGARDHATFGYWTKDTGAIAEPGKTYRARFLLHTNLDDPALMPTFRLRLNTASYELGTTVNIDPAGTLGETLTTDARIYDVYMTIPANDPGTDNLLASLDILCFDTASSTDAEIGIEQFILEEIEIAD